MKNKFLISACTLVWLNFVYLKTMDVTSIPGAAYTSAEPPGFIGLLKLQFSVQYFCRDIVSYFVLFLLPLFCLSFCLRLLIYPFGIFKLFVNVFLHFMVCDCFYHNSYFYLRSLFPLFVKLITFNVCHGQMLFRPLTRLQSQNIQQNSSFRKGTQVA